MASDRLLRGKATVRDPNLSGCNQSEAEVHLLGVEFGERSLVTVVDSRLLDQVEPVAKDPSGARPSASVAFRKSFLVEATG